ncbi:MAG: hypothetical protein N2036_05815 [Bryobacteraceae bacterium]|nr:hypothetical protein [Bryobacteraceae bacterium]
MPEFGAGVWLDEPPPSLWKEEEFLRHAPGAPMRPPIYQFIRLRNVAENFPGVWREIGGSGCWLAFAVNCDPEGFLETEAPIYRSWIADPTIQASDFFVPLLKLNTAESSLFSSRIRHLAAVSCYVRESEEDRGLVIYCESPIEPFFDGLARLEPSAGPPAARAYSVIPDPRFAE